MKIGTFAPKRILAFGAALALLWMTSSVVGAEPLTVTDLAGRSVTIDLPVKRIVCAGPGALRLVAYMNQTEKVVGVEEMEKDPTGRPYAYAHPEFETLPTIGPGGPAYIDRGPDPEATLACKPNLLFVTYMQGQNAEKLQNKLGVPVVVMSYGDLGTFDEAVFVLQAHRTITEYDDRRANTSSIFTQMKKTYGRGCTPERSQQRLRGRNRTQRSIRQTAQLLPPFEF